jgi:hypothetical protein
VLASPTGDGAWEARVLDAADTRNRVRETLTGYVAHIDRHGRLTNPDGR